MKRVQLIEQTPAQADEFTGRRAEVVVESGTWGFRVHDGSTLGGFKTLTMAQAIAVFLTQADFDTEIVALTDTLTTQTDDALEDIIQKVIISRAPVLDILTGPPGGPMAGDRYLIAHAGLSGIFIGHPDEVVEYIDATTVVFSGTPKTGHHVYVDDEDKVYYFQDSGTWTTVNPDLTYQARQTAIDDAIDLKADLDSPIFTGTPEAPTPTLGDDSTKLATTAFVQDAIEGIEVATEADMEAGTSDTLPVTPVKMKFSNFGLKGWVIFHWTGAAVSVTALTDTIASVSRIATGHYTVTMTGGLNFVNGFAIANGSSSTHPGGAGALGMGSSFSGTNPAIDVRFGDAGGSGGQVSDPLGDVCVQIFGETQN